MELLKEFVLVHFNAFKDFYPDEFANKPISVMYGNLKNEYTTAMVLQHGKDTTPQIFEDQKVVLNGTLDEIRAAFHSHNEQHEDDYDLGVMCKGTIVAVVGFPEDLKIQFYLQLQVSMHEITFEKVASIVETLLEK